MSEVADWIGRFHPLVLHLPIGVFCFAFVWQYLLPGKWRGEDGFLGGLFVFGSGSAVLSAALGWLLSQSDGYTAEEVDVHKWTAVVFSALSFLQVYLWKQKARHPRMRQAYHVNFWLLMTALGVTGHFGGTLTHGAGYLSFSSAYQNNIQEDSANISDSTDPSVYVAMVSPVLKQKCVACHQAKKIKGGLRMDGFNWLMKGGKSGLVVKPGDAANSELIRRMLLPLEDDKHMPPKGRMQLSEEEIALMHWWVAKGADAVVKVKEVVANDTIRALLKVSDEQEPEAASLPAVNLPDSVAVQQLKARGYGIRPVVLGSGWLDISAVNVERLESGDVKRLQLIAPQIWQLNVSGHRLPENFGELIEMLSQTRRMDLREAELPEGVRNRFGKLLALEYLNITGTDCTDADLIPLLELKQLKHVYGWKSAVGEASVQVFSRKRPDIKLDLGGK